MVQRFLFVVVFGFSALSAFAQVTQAPPAQETELTPAQPPKSSEYLTVREDAFQKKLDKALQENDEKVTKEIDGFFNHVKHGVSKVGDEVSNLDLEIPAEGTIKYDEFRLTPGYTYRVNPANRGGYYVRSDSYKINPAIDFHKLMGDASPLFFRLGTEAEIKLWRLHDNSKDAHFSKPMSPANFPFTAAGIDKMQPGDLAHFRGNLRLNLGIKGRIPLPAHFQIKGQVVWVREGLFDIFVFKGDENRARLRVSAAKASGPEAKACFGLRGFEIIEDVVVSIFNLDELACALESKIDQTMFLADYVLDINTKNQDVRDAYNQLLGQALGFKNIKPETQPLLVMADPRNNREETRELLLSNMSALDEIYRKELEAGTPVFSRQVDRNFAGSDETVKTHTSKRYFGISQFVKFNSLVIHRDHQVAYTAINPDTLEETTERLYFPTWSQNSTSSFLFGWRAEETLRRASVIYRANEKYEPVDFESMGFHYNYSDRKLTTKEQSSQLRKLKNIMPDHAYSQLLAYLDRINSQLLNAAGQSVENVSITARYYLTRMGAAHIAERFIGKTSTEATNLVRDLIVRIVNSQPHDALEFKPHAPSTNSNSWQAVTTNQNNNFRCDPYYNTLSADTQLKVKRFCEDIDYIAGVILNLVDNNAPMVTRHNRLSELLGNVLFRQIGPGIIFGLVPANAPQGTMHFEVVVTDPLKVSIKPFIYPAPTNGEGAYQERAFYAMLNDISNQLDGAIPDMRLPGDSDSLTERTSTDSTTSTKGGVYR